MISLHYENFTLTVLTITSHPTIMFDISSIKYISAPTLRAWIQQGHTNLGQKFLVVDVRDSDFFGGNIAGAVHYPSTTIEQHMEQLMQDIRSRNASVVVFHCMLSQQRGPRSALKFGRYLESSLPRELEIETAVLQGGFNGWQRRYGEEEGMCENYTRDLWVD